MDKEALLSNTGMTAADVELVYESCKGRLLALAARQHHQNANTPPLTSHNLLVITLHWLRRKPTYQQLAQLYSHGQHYWHTTLRRVICILDNTIYPLFVTPLASDAPTSVFFPNVKIIVDSTFVPLPKGQFIKKDFHKKNSMRSAWKYEIACDFSHRIISCSRGYHGAQHDMHIIHRSDLLDQSSPSALIMGDKGYQGKLSIVVPASKRAKVSKEVQQLEAEKQRGHEMQHERAAIEKQWAVASTVRDGLRAPTVILTQ